MKPFLLLAAVTAATSVLFAASCTVTTAGLNFGDYDPLSGNDVSTSAVIEVACTSDIKEKLTALISLSTGASGNNADRTMNCPTTATLLHYNVYQLKNATKIWGDGNAGSYTQTIQMNLNGKKTITKTADMYGKILGAQDVAVGLYTDALIITMEF